MIADELRRQADLFVDITDLQEDIERAMRRDHPRARPRVTQDEESYDDEPLDDEEEEEEEEDEDYYESQPA